MSQDPHDRLLLQIRSAAAEYERTLIVDRMRRGRLAKYQAGLLLPWTRPPYGYRLDPDNPRDPAGVRVEESEAAVMREIYAWYLNERVSLIGIARRLQQKEILNPSGKKLWSLATLRAILRQPAYLGKVYAGRYRYCAPRIRRSAAHPIGQPHQTAVELPPDEWIFVANIPAIITQRLRLDMSSPPVLMPRISVFVICVQTISASQIWSGCAASKACSNRLGASR